MDVITVGSQRFTVERATAADVPRIVELLRDDPLGATRETSDTAGYQRAFDAIDADPNQFLAVVRDGAGAVVGTMQLTFLPGLSRGGALRLLIEAVRVSAPERGHGLGTEMMAWAHDHARARGAVIAQLTSHSSRTAAHAFYERLGYDPSHVGMKLRL